MIFVASYCRVSTDKDDQANSFESQQQYFKEYISRRPDWELYQTYADAGVTGTSTKNRMAFHRMMEDAYLGKFQLILTKEVSRFSRNILDAIAYTRELRRLGVGVLFLNDGIHTLDPDAELRLSIMGSIAQEESRRTSSRVKWGQTRQMEKGVVFGRSLLGYAVKDGCLLVNPEEAEIVKLIFHKYGIEKKGTAVIARELQQAGHRTHTGNIHWSSSHIVKILKNEKYVGDLIQKKTFTPDYLTHAKKYNHGEEPQIILQNHHEPIIDRELWNIVQTELKRRNRKRVQGAGHGNRYLFSGKIQCGECGASFVSRRKKRKDGTSYQCWCCCTAATEGRYSQDEQGRETGCNIGRMLREELALHILKQSLLSLKMDKEQLIKNVVHIVTEAIRAEGSSEAAEKLEQEIRHLTQKKISALDAFFSESIAEGDLKLITERYDQDLKLLQTRLETLRTIHPASLPPETIPAYITAIVNGETDHEAFYRNIIDHMILYKDKRVEVHIKFLPQKWTYILEPAHFNPSVPISVSNPFNSGYGMENR